MNRQTRLRKLSIFQLSIFVALFGALLASQASVAVAAATDSPSSQSSLNQKRGDVKKKATTCGVDFGATRLVGGSINHGGRTSCYGIGYITPQVFLMKKQPDGDWVVVSYTPLGPIFASSTGATYVDSPGCTSSTVRAYYPVVQGHFDSAAGGPSGDFHQVGGQVSLACNLPQV